MEMSRINNVTREAPFSMSLVKGSEIVLKLLDFDGNDFLVDCVKVVDSIQ